MARLKQKYGLLIIGVLLGALYGLLARLVFGQAATLASITYLFIVPAVLGMIPLFFANEEQLRSYRNIIFIPWLTILTFFLISMMVRLEEIACILMLAAPFIVLGTVGALVVRLILLHRKSKKMLAIAVLPFILSPVEEAIKSPSEVYSVQSEVVIAASTRDVWDNIVDVPTIGEEEFNAGFFNRIGIPRPVSAETDRHGVGGTRIGRFDGGLRFVETLNTYEPEKRVSFSIVVDPASISDRVLDQHVLNGNYFTFIDAAYDIATDTEGRTRLTLISRYRLTSKVNIYGRLWGEWILGDFQERLLDMIKRRSEDQMTAAYKR